jgi:hypothetical protein
MKEGDTVIYIDVLSSFFTSIPLTLYKSYEIHHIKNGMYYIKNDTNKIMGYSTTKFVTELQNRKNKILKLKKRIHGNR